MEAMKTESQKKKELGDFLYREFKLWALNQKGNPGIQDWAVMMEVSPASLGQWMAGIRLPEFTNFSRIARHYPRIYDILEMPRSDDPTTARMMRMMEENPDYKTILSYLLEHPQEIPQFKKFMEQLDHLESLGNNGEKQRQAGELGGAG